MLSTAQLRTQYAPPCTGPLVRVALHGDGKVTVRDVAVDAVRALNAVLVAHDYRTRVADTGAYNCRRVTGGTGYSLHAYGIALDLNWNSNPYRTDAKLITDMPAAMTNAIKRIRTRSGRQVWGWGGDYRTIKDAMHFEIVCPLADLRGGINPATVPGSATLPSGPKVPPTKQRVGGTWRYGDQGRGVHFTQSMLNICGRYHKAGTLTADGYFGPATEGVVRAFQRFGRAMGQLAGNRQLLVVDGIAGPKTLGAIAFWVRAALGR